MSPFVPGRAEHGAHRSRLAEQRQPEPPSAATSRPILDGDVFAFWPDTGSQHLFVAKSTDGGSTFGAPVTIANYHRSLLHRSASARQPPLPIYLSGAAYRTALQNHVYAVWMDLAGGVGCNSSGSEPGNNVASICKRRIWFARSTDGGATWDAPLQLNGQPSLNDQIFPRLALDETTGVLMVVYYDTVNDPGRRKAEFWMQTSYDFGDTWTAPVQVATAETDETVGRRNSTSSTATISDSPAMAGASLPAGPIAAAEAPKKSGARHRAVSPLATAIADSGNFGNVCAGFFS